MKVDINEAISQALFHLYSLKVKHSSLILDSPSVVEFKIGGYSSFYDIKALKEEPEILYVFDIIYGNNCVGRISINATKHIGSTLANIVSFPTKGIFTSIENSKSKATAYYPNADTFIPVVYSYPNLGLGVIEAGTLKGVIDIDTLEKVNINYIYNDILPELSGNFAWSFWDNVPQNGNSLQMWENRNTLVLDYLPISDSESELEQYLNFNKTWKNQNQVDYLYKSQRLLKNAVTENPPIIYSHRLPIPLVGQNNNINCAPTSLSMIYEYLFSEPIEQELVADSMNTTLLGTYLSDQLQSFNSYFGNMFNVDLDRTPTYEEAKDSILNFLPLKSGIIGHARTISGFREETYINKLTGEVLLEEKYLVVNDPKPNNSGSINIENINQSKLKDFITLKRIGQ